MCSDISEQELLLLRMPLSSLQFEGSLWYAYFFINGNLFCEVCVVDEGISFPIGFRV